MSAEDTTAVEFYAPWPDLGKKFNKQLGEIRTDTSSLAPIVRGVGLDADGDWSSLDGVAANAVQARELGKQDFHNKFRTHYNKDDDLFEIAYNTGTTQVPQWYTMWWIDDDGHVTQQNTPTTASNVGSGSEVFKQKVGVDLEFRTLTATAPITLTENATTIDVDGSALVSSYSSDQAAAPSGDADTGVEIILSDDGMTGNDLPFKAIKAGPNVVITNTGTAIQIESTSQVVEFYGIGVGHDDLSKHYPEVHNFLVNRKDFYITQQTTDPSNKTIILNRIGDAFNANNYVEVAGDDMTGPLAQADGSAALPSFTFTDDATMGLYRNAADDLGVAIAGAAHTRFLSDRLFLGYGLQITNTGDASAPDLYFFPDADTGLYQDNVDELAFATGGVQAGYFDSNQDLILDNELWVEKVNAETVEAGLGVFYTQAIADRFLARGTVQSATAMFGFEGYPSTGLHNSNGNNIYLMTEGTSRLYFGTSGGITATLPVYEATGSVDAASYSFTDDVNTGVYRAADEQVGVTCGGTQRGLFSSTGLTVTDDVFVTTEAYGAAWNGKLSVPTKDAVYDKMEDCVTFKESESGGFSQADNTVAFDSARFYVSTGGDDKPLVSINNSILTSDVWEGVANLNKLNDGGLCAGYSVGMECGSDGTTIHFYLTNTTPGANKHDDVCFQFHGEDHVLDISGDNGIVEVTAGAEESPTESFIHAYADTNHTVSLESGTGDWPQDGYNGEEAHAKIATVVVQDAATVKTDGALKIHAWTDHVSEEFGAGSGERGKRGHLHALGERVRMEPAVWRTGCALTVDNSPGSSLYVHTEAGTGYQLHRHTIPAQDTDGTDRMYVVNDGDTPYRKIDDLDGLTHYSDGTAIAVNAHFTVVLWMVVSENQADSNLMINVPSGGYTSLGTAQTDASGKTTYDIPNAYVGTAVLLYELVLSRSGGGGTWTHQSTVDLRGVPGVAIGGGGATLGGEANTASNIGAGSGLYSAKVAEDLQFKSLKAQDHTISVTNDADQVFVSATGNFYAPVIIESTVAKSDEIVLITYGDVSVRSRRAAGSRAQIYGSSESSSVPAFSFNNLEVGDTWTRTGIGRNIVNESASLVYNGNEILEWNANYVELSKNLYLVTDTNAAAPDLAFDSDHSTGVYLKSTWELGFATKGIMAGYFDQYQNLVLSGTVGDSDDNLTVLNTVQAGRVEAGIGTFYTALTADYFTASDIACTGSVEVEDDIRVVNDVKAGHVEAGTANFYTGLEVDGNLTMTAAPNDEVAGGFGQILVQQSTSAPAIAAAADLDSGLLFTASQMLFRYGDANICGVSGSGLTNYKSLLLDTNRTSPALAPAITWTDNINTGVYQPDGAGSASWGWMMNDVEVGKWGSDNNFHVLNDVKAGRVEAGVGNFYTGLTVGSDGLEVNAPTVATQFLASTKGSISASSFGWVTDAGTGFYNPSDGYCMLTSNQNARVRVGPNEVRAYAQLQGRSSSSVSVPMFSGDGVTNNTGIWQPNDGDAWAWTIDGVDAGGFHGGGGAGGRDLTIWDDVHAGGIQAGACQFYTQVGFYDKSPIVQQTGVSVDAAGIHAALVNLGLITA